MHTKSALIIGLLLASLSVYADQADRLTLSAGLSFENSNNINLTPIDRISENIAHVLFASNYLKKTAVLNLKFNLYADRQEYLNHTFANQTVVTSYLSLSAALKKQRLYWEAENKHDRVQISQAEANIPTNQENTNYFTTGPRFVLFKNNKSSLDVDIKYEKFYAEISNSDFSGYLANTSYLRNITRTSAITLDVNYTDRKFDDQILNTDYKRTDATLGLMKKLKLSILEIGAGQTQLKMQNQATRKESIYRAKYQYQLGKKTSLTASYNHQLNDFSTVFARAVPGSPFYTDVNSEIFLLNSGKFSIVRNFSHSSLHYDYVYVSNDYQDDALDTVVRASTLTLTNKLSVDFSTSLSGTYRNTDYANGTRNDQARVINFGVTQKFLNAYDWALGIQYTNNGSTDSKSIYDERLISLIGHYYFR